MSEATPSVDLGIAIAPNPVKAGVWISCSLPTRGWMRVQILDIAGRDIVSVADGVHDAGARRLYWNGRRANGVACAPGVYWRRMEFSGLVVARKMVLLGRGS